MQAYKPFWRKREIAASEDIQMGRTPCCSKEGLNRGAWTAVEDQILRDYINTHGEGKWRNIPKEAGLKRCGKSCRLRWLNYLRPDIKRGNISQEEEDLIIRLHKLLGNRWSLIAGRLPGRTDNEIKNYWNTTLGKKVRGEETKRSKEEKNKTPPLNMVESSSPIRKKLALRRTGVVKAETHKDHLVDNAQVESKSSDSYLSNTSQEIHNPQNNACPMSTEFNFGDLLLSDMSDLEFWKLCQFDNCTEESGNSGGATNEKLSLEHSLSFSEEILLENLIRDDGFRHQS